jgi:hypothetical protein
MTRFERKLRKDINYKTNRPGNLSMFDLMDDALKSVWRINDEEYDFIAENIKDDDIKYFTLTGVDKISDYKIAITIVNQLVYRYVNRVREEREDKLKKLI